MPIIIALVLCEQFMLAIGMDPRASEYAGLYTYLLIPAMFFHSQFDATRQYLNALNKSEVVMYIMIITSGLHLVWCYLLTSVWKLDVVGVSLATLITFFLNFFIVTIYCKRNKEVRKSFFFPTKESFQKLGEYLQIGIPSCCMLCLEWWSFEVLAIMAGYISVDATGAHVIIINTHVVIIMAPLGAQVATIVCVGQAMGEGHASKAVSYFRLVALYSLMLNITLGTVIFFTRESIARIFTTSENLIPMIMDGYSVLILILLLHGMAMVQAGAVRGLGKLNLATWMVFFSFYIVSLPGAYIFAFKLDWGMVGLWWGIVVGSISEVVLYAFFLRFLCDWKRLAIEISEQMRMSPNISYRKNIDQIHEPLIKQCDISNHEITIKTREN
ncbi:na+-driven multidrug efflux pump [Stylonychia lemnae]|uniref:Na+-driven multidrug efflux pump n=1 Tax=Stylonychia lemnae TaxID=5949 RepID=A0A078B3W6_STYLE|nr:na+-driven multidrug efflux pump [Stylonychia lemnae]|eukprot:CDW89184.1 na+-driven multidrug efflux pump [Stylonychia lemnae]